MANKNEPANPFYIVGIGASAGGLEALEQFFENIPSDCNIAFIVIQHLSPDYKSLMVELLSKRTELAVVQATDGISLEPNCIYLIPPKNNMTIFHGKLFLSERSHKHVLNLPIDIFLRSLAEDRGEYAIGVILSGTGSDGTRGIRAIKEAGGMVMVQDEESAKFDGMPRSAISTLLVDYILPPEKMGETLLKFIKHPYVTKKDAMTDKITENEDHIARILSIIRSRTGVDFTYYKRNTIIRRIERRISINQVDHIEDYLHYLYESENEVNILYKELLIGVTKFFRDGDAFDALKNKVFPKLFKSARNKSIIRVWVAGCSTGEEAYSLAIFLQEYMEANDIKYDIKIFATDIDKTAIEIASIGNYPTSIAADVSVERLQRYFVKNGDSYQVIRPVREMVIFAPHNLVKDPPFHRIDLITCRNLLIYLQPVLQKKVMSYFHFALNHDGYLFLGNSETVGDLADMFSIVDSKGKIYAYKGGPKVQIADNFSNTTTDMISRNIVTPYNQQNRFNLSFRENKIIESINNMLMDTYVPPCVVINENYQVIYVGGDVNHYFSIPSGNMNLNILKMAQKDLSVLLGSAIRKVFNEKNQFQYPDVKIRVQDKIHLVNITFKSFIEPRTKILLAVIIFEEILQKEIEKPVIKQNFKNIHPHEDRIEDLEQELQYTKENLQATIEELETSNEELQATNEELLAANEELQSTNEELQSVNEELITLNSEYQAKIQELTELNNDITNLLSSTNIGTIFLDRELRIRKFTPAVTEEINIIEMDIGRPINHISLNLEYDNFVKDAEKVLHESRTFEKEVQNRKNGKWYLIRFLPYKTQDKVILGVVITFIDITDLKQANERISMLYFAMEQSPYIKVLTDLNFNIEYVNHRFTEVTGYSSDEVIGKNPHILSSDETPPEVYRKMRDKINAGQVWKGHFINKKKNGELYYEEASIIGIKNEEGQISEYLKVADDITEQTEMEQSLFKEKNLISAIMETVPLGITVVNLDGRITYANKHAEEILGLTRANILDKTYNDPSWKSNDVKGKPIPDDEMPFNLIMKTQSPIFGYIHAIEWENGVRVIISINGAPLYDADHQISGAVFAIQKLASNDE